MIQKLSFLSTKLMKLMPISVSVNVDAAVFFFGVIIMRLVFQHWVHHHSLIDIINCNLSCAYNLLFCTSNWLYVLFITLSIRKNTNADNGCLIINSCNCFKISSKNGDIKQSYPLDFSNLSISCISLQNTSLR